MIVIPMAGASRRFYLAGYDVPKYRLMLDGRSLFDHAVASFQAYFETEPFLFILRDDGDAPAFVESRLKALGIRHGTLAALGAPTSGQATTVILGLDDIGCPADEPITVFNIDTFRPGFRYPEADWFAHSDGYLEVVRASDPGLSFVRADPGTPEPRVLETAEKKVISDLASTGLYHFRRADDFHTAYDKERMRPSAGELYIAPMYNHLIAAGKQVHFRLLEPQDNVFCGTPQQYQALLRGGVGF
jgi:hypothetical protein